MIKHFPGTHVWLFLDHELIANHKPWTLRYQIFKVLRWKKGQRTGKKGLHSPIDKVNFSLIPEGLKTRQELYGKKCLKYTLVFKSCFILLCFSHPIFCFFSFCFQFLYSTVVAFTFSWNIFGASLITTLIHFYYCLLPYKLFNPPKHLSRIWLFYTDLSSFLSFPSRFWTSYQTKGFAYFYKA